MADDARISTAFPQHPKTVKLQRRLQERGCWALVCLILWVADNRPDGDLSGLAAEDIEIAASWTGDSGAFVACLLEVGFLDGEGLSYKVHDWAVHNPYVASRPQRVEAARQAVRKRWDSTTPEERSSAARHAANARWERDREMQRDACDIPTECVPGERIMRTACVLPSLPFHAPHRASPPGPTPPKANHGADAPKRVSRSTTFQKPTLEEVTAYCKERGNDVDPQRFMDYYTANGWKVGKNPMRDWKATVRTWEGRSPNGKPNGKHTDLAKQDYTNGRQQLPGGGYPIR